MMQCGPTLKALALITKVCDIIRKDIEALYEQIIQSKIPKRKNFKLH